MYKKLPIPQILVHAFTASGAIIAFLIIRAAINHDNIQALLLSLSAMIIDGTDGTLARHLKVKEVLPHFDGTTLDNIVDFLTYVMAPVILLWSNGFIRDTPEGIIIISAILLSSCYQFCRTDAKTDDNYFLGFPDYWNIVAFYAIVARIPSNYVAILVVMLAILAFVPIKYIYPSRTEPYYITTISLTALWFILYLVITLQLPTTQPILIALSLVYPAYYCVMSLYLTYKTNRNKKIVYV